MKDQNYEIEVRLIDPFSPTRTIEHSEEFCGDRYVAMRYNEIKESGLEILKEDITTYYPPSSILRLCIIRKD